MVDIAKILKDEGFQRVPTKVIPNFFLGFLQSLLKDIAMFKDRLCKSQITDSSNAMKVLNWEPNDVEGAIIMTAKQYHQRKKKK